MLKQQQRVATVNDTQELDLRKEFTKDELPRGSWVYRVMDGDILSLIATVYYRTPELWYVIADFNNLDITQPLEPGRLLAIPNLYGV